MKNIILSFAALLAFTFSFGQTTRNLSHFTIVSAQEGIEVILRAGSKETAKITAHGIKESEVLTEVSGGVLKIHLEGSSHSNVEVQVEVTYTSLESLRASSAASIEVMDKISASGDFEIECSSAGSVKATVSAKAMEMDASSSGKIVAEVSATSLDVDVSSAGEVDIKGKTNTADMSASSSGEVSGLDLIIEKADLRVSSGASIKVTVNEKLTGRASSGGSIRYKGAPSQTDAESSSGGSVKKY